MKVIPVNFRRVGVWKGGHFVPKGKPMLVYPTEGQKIYDVKRNPRVGRSEFPMTSARLFVGFNVGGIPTWKMNNLLPIVKGIRKQQTGAADATLLRQMGLYTHRDSGETITEEGAQIIILNLDEGLSPDKFEDQMVELGEVICNKLRQAEVILEIQKGGMTQATMAVVP